MNFSEFISNLQKITMNCQLSTDDNSEFISYLQKGVAKVLGITAEGSNDHFHVFEIWHKNQILSNLSNI